MIVLGSYPVQDIVGRESKDLDLLSTLPQFQKYIGEGNKPRVLDKNHVCFKGPLGRIFDCELIWPDSLSEELAGIILDSDDTKWDSQVQAWVPGLNILYMLKMTHRFKKNSPHFFKTMCDIWRMRAHGATIPEELMDFYKRRLKETLWYEHPNLNRTKEEFFNPEDDFYVYDHDTIHEAIAVRSGPAYWSYGVPGQEVLSSKSLFFSADHYTRLLGVYEEACVLALERIHIPNNFNPRYGEKSSFLFALEKVCTSITSGWFREFAWENWHEVVGVYGRSGSYIERFNQNKHKLRPYERLV